MKRRNRIAMIIIASIIIISNLPPVSYFFQEEYHYQNKDGSFQFSEPGGPTQGFEVALSKFESFKTKNPSNPNTTLFRTFTLKPWRFWEWWQMIKHIERFNLPYYQKKGRTGELIYLTPLRQIANRKKGNKLKKSYLR